MKRFGYLSATDSVSLLLGYAWDFNTAFGPMILYAIVSEVSIGALFLAGLLPGLILASVFAVFCIIQGSRRQGQKRLSARRFRR